MTQVNTHKAVELATQYINSRLSNKITMADLSNAKLAYGHKVLVIRMLS